jgi:hypothetical protein
MAERPFHILIDCGALRSQRYGGDLIRKVVRDIKTTTAGRLDVIVGTHEHWDHISGFVQAEDIFDQIDVGRVWVPWTENPDDAAAQSIKAEFKTRKRAVRMALTKIPNREREEVFGLYKKSITDLLGFYGGARLAAAASGTEKAWDYLLKKAVPVYCHPKNPPMALDGVEGVRVYVLGPPEDPDYIRKKLSSKETYHKSETGLSLFDSFLAAVAGDSAGAETKARAFPFDERHRIAEKDARKNKFFRQLYGFRRGSETEWRRINHDWLALAAELALHLDSYTNNVCLALAFEFVDSGKVLLFPGDAQVGNWMSWEQLSWKVRNGDGKSKKVTIDDLLARTVLYKVGHHGSHNATLRSRGLEKMNSPDLVALIPVHRETAADQDWAFPYPPLWQRLKQRARGRVLLSDAKSIGEIRREVRRRLSPAEQRDFRRMTNFTDLFIEHRIAY